MDDLARDTDSLVRHAVAQRPDCEQSILERLSEDPDSAVRLAVEENPATPSKLAERIRLDAVNKANSWTQ
jgi:hypothetical protein